MAVLTDRSEGGSSLQDGQLGMEAHNRQIFSLSRNNVQVFFWLNKSILKGSESEKDYFGDT
jgi:hypothetical protein